MTQSVALASPLVNFHTDFQYHRVLVVDTSSYGDLLESFFLDLEKKVLHVHDYSNVLHEFDEEPVHLILIDWEFVLKHNLDLQSLRKKAPQALLLLLFDPKTLSDQIPHNWQDHCSGFIIKEPDHFEYLPLYISQAYERFRLQEKQTQLKHSLELTQKDLRSKALQLDTEIKSKSIFINKLSSNFQKPLDQLVQFTHIALQRMQRKQFPQVGHYLAEVKMISEELMSHIQDLKEVSLLKSGESRYNLEEIDMIELLRAIKRQFQPIAQSKEIYLNFQTGLDHPFAKGDFNKLTRVLQILFRNLFKYLPQHGSIEVKAKSDNSLFYINVTQSTEDYKEDMFAALPIQDFSSNMDFSLSICKELMLGQKGDIHLEKSPCGKRIQFVLSIPLADNFLDKLTS